MVRIHLPKNVLHWQHLIRVIVKPPQDVRHLPVFRQDELVTLTTDSHDTLETEVLTGNASEPALGLTTLRPGISRSLERS